jgi:DNA-binding PadR family transcriptional regulator
VYLDIIILAILSRGAAHGYEIKKQVSRVLGRDVELNNNKLYPTLRKFDEAGFIEHVDASGKSEPGRPARQVYRITPAGEARLQILLEDNGPDVAAEDSEFKTRVSFFDRLDPVLCRQLLRRRRRILEERLSSMEALRPESADRPWAWRVLDLEVARVGVELEWLSGVEEQVSAQGAKAGAPNL